MENDNEEIIYEIGNVYLTISSEQIGKGYLTLTNRYKMFSKIFILNKLIKHFFL